MSERIEIAIIGAGPGGIGAACNAAINKLSHVLFERREIGNTVFDYQLGKYVMAEPSKLPLRGKVEFVAGSREQVLTAWQRAVKEQGVRLVNADIGAIRPAEDDHFEISSGSERYLARHVVLAIGTQGSPRRLGVPGDDLPHVFYTLSDPAAVRDRDVLVVGAGDAAIENALALSGHNRVSILNRSADFPRAKEANAAKILEAIDKGTIRCFYNSSIERVEATVVHLETPEGDIALNCNHIIARLGTIMPRAFLESLGIQLPNKDPNAVPVVSTKYESNVPRLYVVGALIGYPLIKQALNQGYEVVEHILGRDVMPADQGLVDEKLLPLGGNPIEQLAMVRAALPFFKDLSDSQFRELIIESTIRRVAPGQVIFSRNEYSDSFISIISGSVAIDSPSGTPVQLSQGNFFGEMSLLSGRRRSATVRAHTDAILLEAPRKIVLKFMNSVESIKRSLDQIFMVRSFQSTVFPSAPADFLVELARRSKQKNFKKGEVLFKEGDPGEVMYVIRKGSVKISRRNNSGQDITQTYLPAGNIVGEMALLSNDPRSATVTAAVPVETILIERPDFDALLSTSKETADRLREMAARRAVQNVTNEQSEQTSELLNFMLAQGVTDADNFLLIDSDLCIGCDNCERACAATHAGASRLDRKGGKSFANVQIPISCRHCENPLCMLDCPPDALTRMPNGEVIIRDSCIGCGNCVRNCPYGVIQLVHDDDHDSGFSLLSLFGIKKPAQSGAAKAAKCDMCSGSKGGPACVRSCPTGAAIRGNPKQMLELFERKGGLR